MKLLEAWTVCLLSLLPWCCLEHSKKWIQKLKEFCHFVFWKHTPKFNPGILISQFLWYREMWKRKPTSTVPLNHLISSHSKTTPFISYSQVLRNNGVFVKMSMTIWISIFILYKFLIKAYITKKYFGTDINSGVTKNFSKFRYN